MGPAVPGDPTAPALVIELPAGTLRHPLPLPPQYPTPCAYVATIGRLTNRAPGTWYIDTGCPSPDAEGAAG
jgi:hypothetical protein